MEAGAGHLLSTPECGTIMTSGRKRRTQVIDREGYRPNVGIILFNPRGELFWARRIGEDAWQFPQGGIRADETPEEALYRELAERRRRKPVCIGQKQRWFLLKLVGPEGRVRLDASDKPEFDHWRWVDPERPVNEVVIGFKRDVYRRALEELLPLVRQRTRNNNETAD